ncbi:MAG: hypothetical protein ABIZ09_06480, partial [Rhodoferax sp.]
MTALTATNLRQRRDILWLLGLWGIFGIFGAVIVLTALKTHPLADDVSTSIRLFIGIATALAWVQGHIVAQSLARAAEVLGQRQVPCSLWTAWLRLSFVQTARTWCIVVVASIWVLSLADAPWRWPTGAALVSVAMALSFVQSLSIRRLLPPALSWLITGGVIVGLLVLSLTTGLMGGLDGFSQWPDWLQLLLVAVAPLLAMGLYGRWATVVPQRTRRNSLTTAVVWRWFKREFKRYTALRYAGITSNRVQSRNQIGLAMQPVIVFASQVPQLHNTVPNWDSTLPLWHPLALAVMVVMCCPNLICKDLHWRMLLAPGGLHRGRLGLCVARSTLEYAFGLSLALLLVAWGISHFFTGLPPLDMLKFIQRYAMLLPQLLFAISVATCLRALPRPGWVLASLAVALCACGALYVVYQAALPAPPEWFKAGPGYVAILLILSV